MGRTCSHALAPSWLFHAPRDMEAGRPRPASIRMSYVLRAQILIGMMM